MRSLVPAFLLFSAVFCLTTPAHAANIRDILASIGCDPVPTEDAKKARCEEAILTYCRISPNVLGCPTGTEAPTPARAVVDNNNAEEQTKKFCKAPHDIAVKCCANDASACREEVKGTASTAVNELLTAAADSEGLKNDCNKSEEINGKGAKATYGLAGVCDSSQKVCADECSRIVDELNTCVMGATTSDPRPKCQEYLKVAKDSMNSCRSKNSKNLVGAAGQYADGSKMAQLCGNLAGDDKDGDGKPDNPSDPGAKDPGTPGNEKPPAKTDPGMQTASTASSMGPMLASMLPALMQMLNPQEQPMAEPVLDRVDCSVNPNLAGCQGTAAPGNESWNEKGGMAEASVQATDTGTFNLPDGADGFTPQSAVPTGTPSNPPTVASVPNGGGGIPGGGGGGPASLGGGGGGGGGAQLGSKADVLHGLGSASGGAFGQQNAAMNMKSGESGGYSYGGGPSMDSGMNLGDFLPGGRQDPTKRALAGSAGQAPANYQIQAKDVNIWNRISERIKSRCSQGLLRDCVP